MTKDSSKEPKRTKRKVRLTKETVRDLNPTEPAGPPAGKKRAPPTNDHRAHSCQVDCKAGATRGNCAKTTA